MRLLFFLCVSGLFAQAGNVNASSGETLRFTLNWPSGLSLGEAQLISSRLEDGSWKYALSGEASLPAFPLRESAESHTSAKGCSLALTKEATRGNRKVDERTEFNGDKAVRTTSKGGGKSEFSISPCAKDAVAYIMFLRSELAAGRLPAAQTVYYGAGYQVRVDFTGTEKVRLGDEWLEADRLNAAVKGPASDFKVELLFSKDSRRTPLVIRIPLAMGKFSMELVR